MSSGGSRACYELRAELAAIHPARGAPRPRRVEADLGDGWLVVPAPRRRTRQRVAPVYSPRGSAELVVATGRLFVVMEPGLDPASRAAELEKLGLEVEQRVAYAAGAAYLVASDGSVARALHALGAVVRLRGIARVEPELLRARASRG